MSAGESAERKIGIWGATGIGVGAIVGGGVLALAGAAFAVTGPSAILAFALNGLIALLTALSFAEISSKFPQSGGTYTFSKKVLSIEAAFIVGWVVWFASIVAAVLYALGFGAFAAVAIDAVWHALADDAPDWLTQRFAIVGLALSATAYHTLSLLLRSAGGGQWVNVGKVAVFAVLIACGLAVLPGRSATEITRSFQPFFSAGAGGLFQAMGFTFIALQGFDLIAAVAGEIRQPERTIPRAMLYSLGLALLIYLPLLFVVVTVGTPVGQSVTEAGQADPEGIIANAAKQYLGAFGYWLVIVAALLSMLSALQANLYAASRMAMSMARDRTLPRHLADVNAKRGTPAKALLVTAAVVAVILLVLPDVAAAGAASSLIFLVSFGLAHWIAVLVRQRSVRNPPPFRVPFFPLVPVVGGAACIALALYQGVAVPAAGRITMIWLLIGGLLFLILFARRARIADASNTALDPELVQLRGRNPLVLVPIANPDNAAGLVAVAGALAPVDVGRVTLLSVIVPPAGWNPDETREPLDRSLNVLGEAIAASVSLGVKPSGLTTTAHRPWPEIARVARDLRCESLLVGLSRLSDEVGGTPLDELMSSVDCDIVVLRAPKGWQLSQVRRILVATGGRGGHDTLLARLLASFSRSDRREIKFLRVLPEATTKTERRQAERDVRGLARTMCPSNPEVLIAISDQPLAEIAAQAEQCDLLILGAQRLGRRRRIFGKFVLDLARKTTCPMLLVSRR